MVVTVILLVIIIVLMICESIAIRRSADKLQFRVHINGTRGKSTVTKFIHRVLLDSDIKSMGKVTGEIPTLLLPDGSSKDIRRIGPARVQEQFRTIVKAKKLGANALVLECMSIDPALQRIESKFFRPTVYIITNIRDDHREKMGGDLDSQVKAICSAIPNNSKVVSISSPYMTEIKKETLSKNSQFIEAVQLNEAEIKRLTQFVHKSNIELALTACTEMGISRQQAFDSILDLISSSDSPVFELKNYNQPQFFLNAFSVNDIESLNDFVMHWVGHLGVSGKKAIVLNTRSDRPLRTKLFVDWINENQSEIEKVIVTGCHKRKAKQLLGKMNLNLQLNYLKSNQNDSLRHSLKEIAESTRLIVGIGNMRGTGQKIIKELSTAL